MSSPVQGPFSGYTVLEIGQFVAVPACGQYLADGGARVLKVEPVTGDPYRGMANVLEPGESRHYLTTNRGKQSVALDIRSPTARPALERLVAHADVVLTNLSPAALSRHRLRWEDLRELNERLVYGVVAAFGFRGDRATKPGMDAVAQATTGLMWALRTFDRDGVPQHTEVPVADYAASMLLLAGVSSALLARERAGADGRGQKVEVSLVGAALALQNSWLGHVHAHDAWRHEYVSDVLPELRRRAAAPSEIEAARDAMRPDPLVRGGYRVLRTADGYVSVGAASPPARARLLLALGLGHLVEAPETDASQAEIATAMAGLTSAEALALLGEHDVPVSRVRHVEEMLFDPDVEDEGLLVDLDHEVLGPYRALVTPIGLSGTPYRATAPSPAFGRHTRAALAEVGFTPAEIDELFDAGVVAEGWPPRRG